MRAKRKGHTGGQNPPGYVPPSRRGKRFLVSAVDPDLFVAMQEIAASRGTTIGKAIERLCRDFVDKHRHSLRGSHGACIKPLPLDC